MQWSNRQPFVPPSILDRFDRSRLRRAALAYAAHGWAVTPGAYLSGHRFDCGRAGCRITGCHPAVDPITEPPATDPATVAAWWRRRPHNLLLPTGGAFDVLEVPAAMGSAAAARHAGAAGPVAVTAAGRWMFWVRPGTPLRPELELRLDVVRHGAGSWVPAPPSRLVEGPVRWVVPPTSVDWRLPAAESVQEVLAGCAPRERRHLVVPRQVSTSRRAA
ncbi:bifunctional DNA primase/polymerase [Actinoplanes sp. NPDC051851]|uniref:bifunctional DNA primase/polymerase n=1 Tax=Actinoplanes sp. NPDC051851 TaxID=3154753 RepID=UPI00342CEEFB